MVLSAIKSEQDRLHALAQEARKRFLSEKNPSRAKALEAEFRTAWAAYDLYRTRPFEVANEIWEAENPNIDIRLDSWSWYGEGESWRLQKEWGGLRNVEVLFFKIIGKEVPRPRRYKDGVVIVLSGGLEIFISNNGVEIPARGIYLARRFYFQRMLRCMLAESSIKIFISEDEIKFWTCKEDFYIPPELKA